MSSIRRSVSRSSPSPVAALIMNVSSKRRRGVEPGRELEQLRPLDEVDLVEDGELRLAALRRARPGSPGSPRSGSLGPPPSWRRSSAPRTSASAAAPQAEATIARSRRRLGANRPGVSTNTICASPLVITPRTTERVVCALRVTIETFSPTSALMSVDLPGVGRADEGDEPAARRAQLPPQRSRKACAAACSAARFELAAPSSGSKPSSTRRITKWGACAGPLRSTSS